MKKDSLKLLTADSDILFDVDLDFNPDFTFAALIDEINDSIAQCEFNIQSYHESKEPDTILQQVIEIETSINSLVQSAPDYLNSPTYAQHREAIIKFKTILESCSTQLPKELETKLEKEIEDSDDIGIARIEKLLSIQLIQLGFKPQDSGNPFNYLVCTASATKGDKFLSKFYPKLSLPEKQLFVDKLVPACVIVHNLGFGYIDFLNPLLTIDKTMGVNFTVTSLAKAIEENPKNLSHKLHIISEEKSPYKKNLLMQFIGYGNVDKVGALLTCAQIASRKSYDILATILELTEVKDYFNVIKKNPDKTMIAHFATSGSHWTSGMIEKQENNHIRMLLIDTLGKEHQNSSKQLVITSFFEVFPTGELFLSKEKVQHASLGCSLFSLDHLRHFAKIHVYLGMPLMQYVAEHGEEKQLEYNDKRVIPCQLPLPLLRLMQSSELITRIIPGRQETLTPGSKPEKDLPINKKQQTAIDCTAQDFQQTEEKISKKRNQRIMHVRDKFFFHNYSFLSKNNEQELKDKMNEFTLKGFCQRTSLKTSAGREEVKSRTSSPTKTDYMKGYYNFYGLMPGETQSRAATPEPESQFMIDGETSTPEKEENGILSACCYTSRCEF